MDYKNIFSNDIEWNYRTTGLFIILLALPNLLGMINLSTATGFKVHFFQIAIFFAAMIYGPAGGALSGLFGSVYSAFLMHNPYIVVGNVILGLFAGIFARKYNIIIAGMLAFVVQLPWLVLSDHYLAGLPMGFITPLVIALALSNFVWAIVVHASNKPVRDFIKC